MEVTMNIAVRDIPARNRPAELENPACGLSLKRAPSSFRVKIVLQRCMYGRQSRAEKRSDYAESAWQNHSNRWRNAWLRLVFGALLGFSALSVASAKTPLIDSLIDQQGKPTAALAKLLALTNAPPVNNFDDLVKQTQAHWYQGQAGKERWQFDSRFETRRRRLIPILRQLKVVDKIQAEDKHYRYGLVYGATAPAINQRLNFLIREWRRGVRFDALVFLTGERPLEPTRDKGFIDMGLKTEREMMERIWNAKRRPAALKRLPLKIVDTPLLRSPDGRSRRPQTGDTIQAWLASKPQPAKAVFISSQPHVGYQHAVAKGVMLKEFDFETIGPASRKVKISVYLDAIARWLYQEKLRRQRQ